MIRDHNWYNLNEQRSWPVDEAATATSDTGVRLPNDILADLQLWFPRSLGPRAALAAVSVRPSAVSLVIRSSTGVLLASVVVPRTSLEPYTIYQLRALRDGVVGQIVFGNGALSDENIDLRFSTNAQSFLVPKTTWCYATPPVLTLGKLNAANGLSGDVLLEAGDDIELVEETVVIDSAPKRAIVVNLVSSTGVVEDIDRNVSKLYAGPCAGRPESKTCGDPEPIEAINTVSPDCCGYVYVELQGCIELTHVQSGGSGVVLDCAFGQEDACVKPWIPDEDGRLPIEADSLCENHDDPETTTTTRSTPPVGSSSSGGNVDSSLPWSETFDDAIIEPLLVVVAGAFTLVHSGPSDDGFGGDVEIIIPDPSPSYSTVVFKASHGLVPGNRFVVLNSSQPEYHVPHRVIAVDSSTMVTTDVPYSVDAEGGVWLRLDPFTLSPGNSYVGSIGSIINSGGNTRLELNEQHNVAVGSVLGVTGNSVAAYNAYHTVTSKPTGTSLITDVSYTSAGTGGAYTLLLAGAGGRLDSAVKNPSNSRFLLQMGTLHGLSIGDRLVLTGNGASGANRLHTVTSVPDDSSVVTDVPWTADGLGGMWFAVSRIGTTGIAYESDPSRAFSAAMYNRTGSWTIADKAAETILSLENPGGSHNGGILINYKQTGGTVPTYALLEVSADAPSRVVLWYSPGTGALQPIFTQQLPVSLGNRYKLVAGVRYSGGLLTVIGSVVGITDNVNVPINYSIPMNYSDGLFGLGARSSRTRFEYLTVRNF